jgi:hypothetical protein
VGLHWTEMEQTVFLDYWMIADRLLSAMALDNGYSDDEHCEWIPRLEVALVLDAIELSEGQSSHYSGYHPDFIASIVWRDSQTNINDMAAGECGGGTNRDRLEKDWPTVQEIMDAAFNGESVSR